MKDRRVILKGVMVTKRVDDLINDFVSFCNYKKLRINGGDKISVSILGFYLFHKTVYHSKDKEAALRELITSLDLKDSIGAPLSDAQISGLVKELLSNET